MAELGRRDSVNPRMLRVLGFKEVMKLWGEDAAKPCMLKVSGMPQSEVL